jgi:hypothetical protein
MYSEWSLPEEGACVDVTFHLNTSSYGTRVFTTKGMVTCENGFVKSAAWWQMVNGTPTPATDCTNPNNTLMGYAACSFAEQAKIWSGECATCPHVNLVRSINETQYYKMDVNAELQAFAPSCVKALVTPVEDWTNSTSDEDSSSIPTNTLIIIGAVLGAILLIAIIVGLFLSLGKGGEEEETAEEDEEDPEAEPLDPEAEE